MIDQIAVRFGKATEEAAKIVRSKLPKPLDQKISQPPEFCLECIGESFWRPHQSDQWFCSECRKPATEALVAERFNQPEAVVEGPVEVSEVIVMAGAPVCRNCGGAWYVERWEGVDGLGVTSMQCWTCRHPVDGEIQVDLIRKPRRRGLCQSRRKKPRKIRRSEKGV